MTVHWTEVALGHLREIEQFIARSSPQNARELIERIFTQTEAIHALPRLGFIWS